MQNRFTNRPIFQAQLFFFLVIIWSTIVQFFPIHENAYQYVSFLIPISIYLFLHRDRASEILKLKALNLKSILLIPLIWFAITILINFIVAGYSALFGDELIEMISEESSTNPWVIFLFTAITPAFFEELIMRGIVLDGYRHKRVIVAAVMNGFLFGILHMNTYQFAYTFIVGIVATYLVYATGSIYSSMWLHLINNGFPQLLELLPSGEPDGVGMVAESSGCSELVVLGVLALFGVIITIVLIKWLFKINGRSIRAIEAEAVSGTVSTEKVLDWPLILSFITFVVFSALLLLSL